MAAVGAGDTSASSRPETRENPDAAAAVAGAVPTGAAAGGFMRRLSRPKPPPPPAERGFQRVSGRKLPSQFSPGMEGPVGPTTSSAAAAGARQPSSHYASGGTFLSTGTVQEDPFRDPSPPSPTPLSGAAAAAAARQEASSPSERERILPGPARTPTLHQGESARTSHLAHLQAPPPPFGSNVPGRGVTPPPPASGPRSLNRSPASFDSSRGSRFQEDFV
ncbi:MAG: hypothetical protein Q9162_002004 [Coniocarpon cinnabarinum]